MALASQGSGTQTCVVGTEHTLLAFSGAKTLVLSLDLNNLANGDELECRVKAKVLSGGTERLAYMATFAHAQLEPVVFSVPVPVLYSATFTLKQTSGVAVQIPWNVVSLD